MVNLDILEEIYHNAGTENFMTLYELEVNTGMTGSQLQNIIEDLKDGLYITEQPEGYQISTKGIHFCKTKWV